MVNLWSLDDEPEAPEPDRVVTYAEACMRPDLFGPWFAAETWNTWRVLDKALFGEPLAGDELLVFKALTGLDSGPSEPVQEGWLIAGRRSGKDVKAASICVYLATIGAVNLDLTALLVPGETAVVQLLAVDRSQAAICLSYIRAMLEQPAFAWQVVRDTADGIELNNGLTIEVTTNDKRRVRGRTVVAVVFDEVAFWRSENSVNPDEEVYNAVRPAMATIPTAMLIGISSPYARKGLLWNKYRKHYGKPGRVLVAKAPTWIMNPTLKRDEGIIATAYEDDPSAASAEYGAEFRSDIETFISNEALEACTTTNILERPPIPGTSYYAFADPSGGSSDSFTLAIAHYDRASDRAVLDLAREIKPPFDPAEATAQFAKTISVYNLDTVEGDNYAAQWVVSAFAQNGIQYERSKLSRSGIYLELLPALNSGKVDLLDIKKLHNQFLSLERRTARGGKDSVDHPPSGHDDLANAVAGALRLALEDQGESADDYEFVIRGNVGRWVRKPSQAEIQAERDRMAEWRAKHDAEQAAEEARKAEEQRAYLRESAERRSAELLEAMRKEAEAHEKRFAKKEPLQLSPK